MDIGIAVCSAADSWKIVERAEALGFTHAWFYDTQQLCADVFVSMAAAAMKTSRIRLGTGVLIPTNRLASVTANALASLNKLAPGRIDFGIGTGFTARRTMGAKAMKLKDLEDYVSVVYGMLRGETVSMEFEGEARQVAFLNPELGLINLEDPIRLHVSAFGPRSRELAARLDAGWLDIVFSDRTGIRDLERMRQSRAAAGRSDGDLYATMFGIGCVLDEGERLDSPRVMSLAGPSAAVFLHSVVEAEGEYGQSIPLPADQRALTDQYLEIYRSYAPSDARYLSLHRGHMMSVRDDERHFITPELIRAKSWTGTRDDLVERFAAMKAAGYTQIAMQLMPGHEDEIERWAEVLHAAAAA